MPEITRREFIRGSAIIAGAAVILDPTWLIAESVADTHGRLGPNERGRDKGSASDGPSAQVEYGDGDGSPLVRWTRFGDEYSLELWTAEIVLDAPVRSETMAVISLADFEYGRGHHEVTRFFGAGTLAQLRTEVTHRAVLYQ